MATAPEAAVPADVAEVPEKKKRALPLWLTITLASVLICTAAGGGFLLMHSKAANKTQSKAVHHPSGPPHYLPLKPFVVNFQGSQQARYLQVALQVMSRDPKTLTLIQQNDPVVRNNLLLLLGSQQATVLATEAGKQQLRAAVLAAIRKIVANAGGHPNRVAAIYFTSFVMQ
ncbi:MAG: flagellar basal body-associated FliL family protein [Pseudomonadota bacterium]|jgi:flagellar FliL protein|nr:flagellar basal body-associated FliL family protein [Pseudomonadota bacterium]